MRTFFLPVLHWWSLASFLLVSSSLFAAPPSGGSSASSVAFDPVLLAPSLWTMSQSDFEGVAKGMNFRWVSTTKDAARSAGGVTVFGMPAVETVVRFDAEKLKEITAVIYGRGDAGSIDKVQYEGIIRESVEALNRATGVKFTARGKDAASAVKADGVFWTTPQAHYLLEYSATKEVKAQGVPFRAEFVRLSISPPPKTPILLSATASTLGKARFSGVAHLQRDAAGGDVLIAGVPMVDQGQKGYCVVASAERVMRFYGAQVDANELAQIANSDAAGGTSYEGMFTALKKVGTRLRVKVRQIEETSVKSILELVKEYNRAAKKAGEGEIPDPGMMIDVGAIYSRMKLPVLKEVRIKNHSAFGHFQRELERHIDQGFPLLWSVQLGMVPEPHIPQNAGGHMRLIIGYNARKNEVIFSDSWGAGHEEKRMPMDDAWAITMGLAVIEPL